MNSKKILIVTYGFYPVQSPRSFRATELAIELARQGHEVTILGPDRAGIDDFLSEHKLRYISYGDIHWKIPKWPGNGRISQLINRAMVRGLSLLMEYPSLQLMFLLKKILKELSGFDALISIAVPYPLHWGVASTWQKDSTKNPAKVWIADCGDPYFGRENDTFKVPFYFAWIEKWFMKKADYITVPTETAIKGYFAEFHHKIKVIPQGFRFKEYNGKRSVPEDVVHFVYGGGFIQGRRDPRELIRFLNEQCNTLKFRFDIYTTTPHLADIHIGPGVSIFVHSPVQREEFLEIASGADFVVNFNNIGTVQTPSKLIDYAILNKPILNITTGNLDKYNVLKFLNRDFSQNYIISDAQQYRIENVAKKFLDLVDTKI